MNAETAFEIIELGLHLVKAQSTGLVRQDVALADLAFQILEKGVQTYRDHSGQPLDPSIIKPENPV